MKKYFKGLLKQTEVLLEQVRESWGAEWSKILLDRHSVTLKQWLVFTESTKTLEELEAILNQPQIKSEYDLQVHLTGFLQARWLRIKDSCLRYTAMPDDRMTRLCLQIAVWLNKREPTKKVYQYLMPTLRLVEDKLLILEENIDDYPLNQCILDSEAAALLPVYEIIANINPQSGVLLDRLTHPFKDDGNQPFTADEKWRLLHHSSITRHMAELLTELDKAEEAQSLSLGYWIKRLIQDLQKGGETFSGEYDNAGESAMVGLVTFKHFWDSLDPADREKVGSYDCSVGPSQYSLQQIITTLTRRHQLIEWDFSNPVCVELNANYLQVILNKHYLDLYRVNSRPGQIAHYETLLKSLEHTQQFIQNRVIETGRDQAGMSLTLLKALNVGGDVLPLCVVDLESLVGLVGILQETELVNFTSMKQAAQIAIRVGVANLSSCNSVIHILNHCTTEQRVLFLDQIIHLLPNFIRSIEELAKILEELSEAQQRLLLEQDDIVLKFVRSTATFIKIYLTLSESHGKWFLYTCLNQGTALIESLEDLIMIFECITPTLRSELLTDLSSTSKIGNRLPQFVKSTGELTKVMSYLTVDQRAVLFDKMGNKLSAMIHSSRELVVVLSLSNLDQCRDIVYNTLGRKLTQLIKSRADLVEILTHLSVEKLSVILAKLGPRLPNFIGSYAALEAVTTLLEPEARSVLQDYWFKMLIRSLRRKVGFWWLPRQSSEDLSALQNKLSMMLAREEVRFSHDEIAVLSMSTFKQHITAFEQCYGKLQVESAPDYRDRLAIGS